ncbi:MAG: hypothetical protein LBM77_05080 [Spirochaetaceae bacterium]|nr:hypothetical protein [Spirochaetaceae bacterium]
MNQDQVKELLLQVEDAPLEFSVVFSGKKSKKVNGLYKPESREIIVHNRNFEGDNQLIYTALHEYAHHLDACSRGGKLPGRAHTAKFRAILHSLLEKAEEKGLYQNVYAQNSALAALTDEIREKYLRQNGLLMKQLGETLLKAEELCRAAGGRFEDYVERVLCIPHLSAEMAIRSYRFDLDPSLGTDNMRYLSGLRDDDKRQAAESALLHGHSSDEVQIALREADGLNEGGIKPLLPLKPPSEDDEKERLEKERERIEKTIKNLEKRLADVEKALEEF